MEGLPKPGKYISKNDGRTLTIWLLDDSQDYVDAELSDDVGMEGGLWEVKEINELLKSGDFEWKEEAPEDEILEDDEQKPFISPPKIGRNAPCPCGSGKKYKRCCGQSS